MKSIAALLVLCSTAFAKPPTGATSKVDHVIVVVDGKPIWHSQLEELYERNQLTKPTFDQTQIAIDTLIDATILDVAAARLGVVIEEAELDQAIKLVEQQNNIDDAGLDKALEAQHFTRATYREELARQLRQAKVFNADFAAKVQISEDEIKAMYDQAKKQDPSLGPLEKEHDRIRGVVFQKKGAEAEGDWLVKQKAMAHIEKRP